MATIIYQFSQLTQWHGEKCKQITNLTCRLWSQGGLNWESTEQRSTCIVILYTLFKFLGDENDAKNYVFALATDCKNNGKSKMQGLFPSHAYALIRVVFVKDK